MKPLFSVLVTLLLSSSALASDSVLYCFTADWCTYCRQMEPVVQRLKQEGYPVQVVDQDRNPRMAQQMGVRGLPYFVVVSENRIIASEEGATSYENLVRMMQVARPVMNGQERAATPAKVQPASYQTPKSQPHLTSANGSASAQQNAMGASVKLRVTDPNGVAFGSGTVIHAQGSEALVLTCGHLFRDSGGKAPIEVLTYHTDPNGHAVPGRLLDFDLDQDVALVAIQTATPMPSVSMAAQTSLQIGQSLFAIGCDHGAERQLHPTRVNSLNRYVGPENIEIAGAPAVGRSGGGLFTQEGKLIGVCNAADDEDDEGIYAGLTCVRSIIESAQLTQLFENGPSATAIAATSPPVSLNPPAQLPLASNPAPIVRGNNDQQVPSMGQLSAVEQEVLRYIRGQKGGTEVTVVLRSKDNPTAKPAVFTLPQTPSAGFLRQATQMSSPGVVRGQSR